MEVSSLGGGFRTKTVEPKGRPWVVTCYRLAIHEHIVAVHMPRPIPKLV